MLNLHVYFGRPRLLSPSGAQRNMRDIQLLSKHFGLYLISDLPGVALSFVLYFLFPKNIFIVIISVILWKKLYIFESKNCIDLILLCDLDLA